MASFTPNIEVVVAMMRRTVAGLALVALLGACTETTRAPAALAPAPGSGASARPVVVSNGSATVATPAVPAGDRSGRGAADSAVATGVVGRAAPRPTAASSPASRPAQSAAARQLSQAAPAKAGTAPAKPNTAAAPGKPGAADKPAEADPADDGADTGEPAPTPRPTMRPAHIPRREARAVFAPGRTSFVKDRGRDGVGFYRPGELTPAAPRYAPPAPAVEPDFEEIPEEGIEEGTP
jgi:hypothetical protein